MHPVAAKTPWVRGAPTDACLKIGHPVVAQQGLKRDDLPFLKRLLGEHHDINTLDFVERSKKHPVDNIEIKPVPRYEFKKPERFLREPLDRARHNTEVG